MKKILKYIGDCLCLILVVIIIISITETFFIKNEYPFVYKTAVILSGSMEPTISVDDLVIVKRAEEIKKGDIIVFYDEKGNEVIHRVIDIDDDTITTQGDANNTADTPISRDKVCGKYVTKIRYVGKIIKFIKTPLGVLICFILTIIILVLPEKYEGKHSQKSNSSTKIKTIIVTILYAILLIVCIVGGYYSKYTKQMGGDNTGTVASFLAGINKTEEVNLFETSNVDENILKGKIIPGMEGNVDIIIYNKSEVSVKYNIYINESENKYNIPIKYSLDGINYYTPQELTKQKSSTGSMKYLEGEKKIKIYWRWDLEGNTNDDTELALKSEDIKIVTQISVEFIQID